MEKNMYTRGNEFTLDGADYIGYYHLMDDGIRYTEKSHSDTSKPLAVVSDSVRVYNEIRPVDLGENPKPHQPIPTADDYARGWFVRYFARKVNDSAAEVHEISEDQFNAIFSQATTTNFPLYTVVSLRWKIAGPRFDDVDPITLRVIVPGVEDTNARSIALAEKTLPNISSKLTKLDQFYESSDAFAEQY
jgi:hypothetical protein